MPGSNFCPASKTFAANVPRSEERFSRNAETDLVCRLLLEKNRPQHRLRGGAPPLPVPHARAPRDRGPHPPRCRCATRGVPASPPAWRGEFGRFFFNETATTETYPLSPHDALPI